MPISSTYSKTITIPKSAIDENGHVNNVTYVQWMQDIAVEHYASIGGVTAQGPGATWVVREHKIEYFLPAFESEEIEIKTWVEEIGMCLVYYVILPDLHFATSKMLQQYHSYLQEVRSHNYELQAVRHADQLLR